MKDNSLKSKSAHIILLIGEYGNKLNSFLSESEDFVDGIKKRVSSSDNEKIYYLYENPQISDSGFTLHYLHLEDKKKHIRTIKELKQDDKHICGARTNGAFNFKTLEYVANSYAMESIGIFELIRDCGYEDNARDKNKKKNNF